LPEQTKYITNSTLQPVSADSVRETTHRMESSLCSTRSCVITRIT